MSIADRINEQYNNLLGGNKNDKTETTIKQDFSIADRINEQYNNLLGKKTIQQISPQTTVVKKEPQYSFLNKSTGSVGGNFPIITKMSSDIINNGIDKQIVDFSKEFASKIGEKIGLTQFVNYVKDTAKSPELSYLLKQSPIEVIKEGVLAGLKVSQDVFSGFTTLPISLSLDVINAFKKEKIKEIDTKILGKIQPYSDIVAGRYKQYEKEAKESGLSGFTKSSVVMAQLGADAIFDALKTFSVYTGIGMTAGKPFVKTIQVGTIKNINVKDLVERNKAKELVNEDGVWVEKKPSTSVGEKMSELIFGKQKSIEIPIKDSNGQTAIIQLKDSGKNVDVFLKINKNLLTKIKPQQPIAGEISAPPKFGSAPVYEQPFAGYGIIKNNLIPQVSRYNQEAGRILSNIDFSGINSLTGLKMKMLNALPPELKTKAIVDSIDSWFRSAEQAVDFIKSEKKSEKTNIQVSKNKKSLIKKQSVEAKQVSQQAETKIPKELEISGQQLQAVSIPTSPEIKTEPEVKPEVKQGIKSAGEIGEKMLGGRVHPVKDIKQQKQNWFASKLESVFPKLKAKKIEQEIGREVVQEMPNDLSGIETLFNFILPKRTLFSRNYLASEMVAKSIKTVLIYKEQLKTFNNYFKSLNKKYNFDKKQKEQFADYIELGLSDEKVETLPEPYKSAIKEYRQLSELIIELLDDVGVDVSKFRFDITNYLHHYFSGTHEVFSPSKNTRLFFGSYKDAIDFVSNYIKQYPKSDVVVRKRTIDIKPTTTQLSTKGFRKLLLQLSNILSISPKEVIQNNLLKGVAGVEKKRVFIGALLPRKVNLSGYLKDPFAVQKILLSKVLKKKYVEGLTKELRRDLNKLPRGYREEMKNYIKAIETEGIIDPSLYKIQKGVGKIKTFQASTKLGWGLRQIGVNRIQHFTFSLADVGIKYYVNGIRFSKTAEGKELIKKSNITGSPAKYDAGNFEVNNDVKFYHPLFGFSKSEVAVRGETLCMYYLYAKDRFILEIQNKTRKEFGLQPYKKAEDLWLDYAIREVAGSMGMYNYTDFPKIMLLPVGKLTLQFQFLRLIWLDKAFRTTLGLPTAGTEIFFKAQPRSVKENIQRAWIFWFNTFLTTGVRPFSKLLLKILGTELGLMFAYFIVKHPKIASGISALFGVDLSSSFSTEPFGVIEQNSLFDSLGVNAADLKKAYTAIQKYREKNWKAGTNILLTVAPNIARVAEAIFFMEDGIKQNWWTDVPQAKFSIPERIVYGLGLTPLKLTKARDMSAFISLLNSSKELTNKQIRNAINKEKDINKAISLAVEWNTHFLKMYDLIIQRTEEITDKKITDDNKIKLLKKYLIEAKEFRNLGITSVTDEMLKTFGVEKMLDIKQ